MRNITDFNVENKRILIRCDFNVPLDDSGNILDDFKIKETLPTIQYLIENKAKIILISHLGDPNGGVIEYLRLDKVKNRIEELIGTEIKKAEDCTGLEVQDYVSHLNSGEILLLENLRFHEEEKNNDTEFAKELSKLGDIFVNDAFAECHRSYASIVGIPNYLPHGAGLLLEKEIKNLSNVLENPERPMIILIGGKKVHDKAKFIERMLVIADSIIVSGLIKKELDDKKMNFKGQEKILWPSGDLEAQDISEETIKTFKENIAKAQTIVWNGPFGKTEDENFINGTLQIAEAIIKGGAYSVVGGGSTVDFIRDYHLLSKFNHVSTGGGAMLEFLSGEKLPGIEALGN